MPEANKLKPWQVDNANKYISIIFYQCVNRSYKWLFIQISNHINYQTKSKQQLCQDEKLSSIHATKNRNLKSKGGDSVIDQTIIYRDHWI